MNLEHDYQNKFLQSFQSISSMLFSHFFFQNSRQQLKSTDVRKQAI